MSSWLPNSEFDEPTQVIDGEVSNIATSSDEQLNDEDTLDYTSGDEDSGDDEWGRLTSDDRGAGNKHHAKFGIKMWCVCVCVMSPHAGYTCSFDICCGKTREPPRGTITKTHRTAIQLLNQAKLLNLSHNVGFDNYFSSPALFQELYQPEITATGYHMRPLSPSLFPSTGNRRIICLPFFPLFCIDRIHIRSPTPSFFTSVPLDALYILTQMH